MFLLKDKYVFGMALIRCISGLTEFSAALLMLKLDRVEHAMKINALLALVGPVVLISTTTIGLAGLAGKVSPVKMAIIGAGVTLIFIGVNK
ncbi:MAG: YqhV family protein [Clostridia bacterium]|nr:YqhV family protein [Clostridia bacterium]